MKMLLITENTDAMIGMRLAGVEAIMVRSRDEAASEIKKAAEDGETGILFITAEIEKMCKDEIFGLRQALKPLVSVIPDSQSDTYSQNAITEYIADAIGIKI